MRRPPNAIWLLLGLAVLAVLVSRLARGLGPAGIVLTFILVMVLIGLARELLRARSRPSGLDRWRAATKNVTPHEPALPGGATPPPGSTEARGPSVIVVEPSDGTDRLGAKLEALDRLRAEGLVSDDEYEAKRAQLIAEF